MDDTRMTDILPHPTLLERPTRYVTAIPGERLLEIAATIEAATALCATGLTKTMPSSLVYRSSDRDDAARMVHTVLDGEHCFTITPAGGGERLSIRLEKSADLLPRIPEQDDPSPRDLALGRLSTISALDTIASHLHAAAGRDAGDDGLDQAAFVAKAAIAVIGGQPGSVDLASPWTPASVRYGDAEAQPPVPFVADHLDALGSSVSITEDGDGVAIGRATIVVDAIPAMERLATVARFASRERQAA